MYLESMDYLFYIVRLHAFVVVTDEADVALCVGDGHVAAARKAPFRGVQDAGVADFPVLVGEVESLFPVPVALIHDQYVAFYPRSLNDRSVRLVHTRYENF